jgi:hypothetical protein
MIIVDHCRSLDMINIVINIRRSTPPHDQLFKINRARVYSGVCIFGNFSSGHYKINKAASVNVKTFHHCDSCDELIADAPVVLSAPFDHQPDGSYRVTIENPDVLCPRCGGPLISP